MCQNMPIRVVELWEHLASDAHPHIKRVPKGHAGGRLLTTGRSSNAGN